MSGSYLVLFCQDNELRTYWGACHAPFITRPMVRLCIGSIPDATTRWPRKTHGWCSGNWICRIFLATTCYLLIVYGRSICHVHEHIRPIDDHEFWKQFDSAYELPSYKLGRRLYVYTHVSLIRTVCSLDAALTEYATTSQSGLLVHIESVGLRSDTCYWLQCNLNVITNSQT